MESGQTLKNKNIVMSYGGKRLECVKNTLKKIMKIFKNDMTFSDNYINIIVSIICVLKRIYISFDLYS